ncbi:hypothetical protein [Endozoicomonas sp.]|uniref:hypothetical protein n=1 Tax=Endozoicomonas sp. TaxID=1892382 RepID=UPI00383AE513
MTLFKGVPKDPTCANIKWMKSNRAPFYQHGYKLAADKLCSDFELLHVSENDSLIFPIIFLHRHYIELPTKDIIYKLRHLLSINEINWDTHKTRAKA